MLVQLETHGSTTGLLQLCYV